MEPLPNPESSEAAWAHVAPDQREACLRLLGGIHAENNAWIRASDAKPGPMVAAASVLIGLVLDQALKNADFLESHAWLALFVVADVLLLLGSALAGIHAIAPLLGTRRGKPVHAPSRTPDTILYFGHIAAFESDEAYARAVVEVFDHPFRQFEGLSRQVRINAAIAARKFGWVSLSARLFILGVGLLALLLRTLAS